MKKNVFIFILIFLIVGCATVKLAIPSQSDVDRVISKYPDYTLTELNQGKGIYTTYCNNCHSLKSPGSRSETEWKEIVPTMVKKVNNKKRNAIGGPDEQKLLKYLITMSELK